MFDQKFQVRASVVVILFFMFIVEAYAQTCSTAAIGIVSAYSGDGNALDARSHSDGAIQGNVTYASGEAAQAFQLGGNGNASGNGDRVIIGNPSNLRLQNFTIEAWIKRSSASVVTNSPVVASSGGTFFAYGQNGYGFTIDESTGRLILTKVGSDAIFSTATITDVNYHHVAVTKTGNQVVFYVDGVAGSPITYGSTFIFTSNAAIGARGDNDARNAFFGAIDELAIYNRGLSGSEVQSIFNSGMTGKCKPLATNVPDNQVIWLAGDGDANDISGNGNNGTLTGGTSFAIGKVGQGFSFNGSGEVNIPNAPGLNPTSQITLEGWVYPTTNSIASNSMAIIANKEISGSVQYEISRRLTSGGCPSGGGIPTGNFAIYLNLAGLPDDCGGWVNGNGNLPLNAWSHVAMTYDGANLRAYVNGNLTRTIATGGAITTNNGPLRLGKRLANPEVWVGQIDEFSIYNRALSGAETTSVFDAGLAGKYKVQSTVPSNITAWFPGDGNPNDLQGANTATLENGATYGVGKVGQGFVFDGVDDQITVPHNADQNGGSSLTIEAWVNPVSLPHGGTIFQKRTSGNIGGYLLETTQTSGGGAANGLQFVIMIGGVYRSLNPANIVTTGAWQHVAATYDGAFMRLYVNGVEVGTRAQTGAIDASTANVVIGRNAVNQSIAFQGSIDEVSLYSRALTANEIRDVYYAQSGGKYKGSSAPTVISSTKTGDVAITFAGITTAGDVHQTSLSQTLLPALPLGTATGLNYDISTSTTGADPTACFNLPSFTAGQFFPPQHLPFGVRDVGKPDRFIQ